MQRNELIGHQVVCSVFIEKDGKFLIVMCPGFKVWRVPGGRSEHGETLEDTVVREMCEETRLNFKNPRFIGWAQDQQYLIRDGKETSRLLMFFHVETEEEPILDPGEADDFKWVTLDELKRIENKEGALSELFHRYPDLRLNYGTS